MNIENSILMSLVFIAFPAILVAIFAKWGYELYKKKKSKESQNPDKENNQ